MPKAQAKPHTIEAIVCHTGMGSVAAVSRRIITKGVAGGMNPAMVASMPFGFCTMGIHSMSGTTSTIITGPTSDCASRRSLTALPTADIIAATMKYAMMKKTPR